MHNLVLYFLFAWKRVVVALWPLTHLPSAEFIFRARFAFLFGPLSQTTISCQGTLLVESFGQLWFVEPDTSSRGYNVLGPQSHCMNALIRLNYHQSESLLFLVTWQTQYVKQIYNDLTYMYVKETYEMFISVLQLLKKKIALWYMLIVNYPIINHRL